MYQALFPPPPHKSLGMRLPSVKQIEFDRKVWSSSIDYCNMYTKASSVFMAFGSTESDGIPKLVHIVFSQGNLPKNSHIKYVLHLSSRSRMAADFVPTHHTFCIAILWTLTRSCISDSIMQIGHLSHCQLLTWQLLHNQNYHSEVKVSSFANSVLARNYKRPITNQVEQRCKMFLYRTYLTLRPPFLLSYKLGGGAYN